MSGLVEYVTPVSIDHAGMHPSKRPGDVWVEEFEGRWFRLELVGQPKGLHGEDPCWAATVLCDCHVQELAARPEGVS